MATLLVIVTDALKEIGKFSVPTTIVNNADPTAVQLLALANRTGRILAEDYRWQVLLTDYTFVTADGTAAYALPSDFQRFANITFWDRTNDHDMVGPLPPAQWETLQSGGVVGAGIRKYFRIAGSQLSIYPTPTATETIAYQYYSTNWISGKAAFTLDADVPLIDSDLIRLGVKYRFLASKGLPYEEEKDEYERRRDSLQAADGGAMVLSFGARRSPFSDNLPESGFGT